MTTQQESPAQPLQHHFVVYGQRNDDGTISFNTDDESLMSRFDNSAIYDPNTEEWLRASELLNDEDLHDEDLAISEALNKLLETPVSIEEQIGDDA